MVAESNDAQKAALALADLATQTARSDAENFLGRERGLASIAYCVSLQGKDDYDVPVAGVAGKHMWL